VTASIPGDELDAVFGDRRAVGRVEALPHTAVAAATAGLYRVHGDGRTAIVKVLAPARDAPGFWRPGANETHWYYWRREAEAYRSGLLATLGGGLRAPRCDRVFERADGTVALWLEDLRGAATRPACSRRGWGSRRANLTRSDDGHDADHGRILHLRRLGRRARGW
jgi:hypothetical protein